MSGPALRARAVAVALAGLLVAAGLGALASRITNPSVGLSGQPVSAGESLVAGPDTRIRGGQRSERREQRNRERRRRVRRRSDRSRPEPNPTVTPEIAQPPVEDEAQPPGDGAGEVELEGGEVELEGEADDDD